MPISTISLLAHKVTQPIKALCGLLLFISPLAVALDWHPYHASYDALRSGRKLGSAQQILEYAGDNQYRLSYHSEASFLFFSDERREFSLFRLDCEKLIPLEYQYQRSGTGKDRATHIRFDDELGKLFVNDKTHPWQAELDNQLYQLAMRAALQQGQREFHFPIVNERGDFRTLDFKAVAEEKLTLPYGQIEAIKVARIREGSDRETFYWFAPSLNYLLVRIQQFKDGDEQADLLLRRYQPAQLADQTAQKNNP
ncbi:DUF3108 domain-containing protein [Bowmanella sp. JS7-9]|uniref:DUF3108 domain-containing protein n=1 Tax=Pseudobowmanella zhangzhouensis TaxID=1537679 RepID=A0ABW1XJ92_9ALTE|nr:DUF3108 domain-containing protein [Bowmanella sp. JS7-9]